LYKPFCARFIEFEMPAIGSKATLPRGGGAFGFGGAPRPAPTF
jgi:hypothetical protein